jgi:hypothetical protein
MARVRKFITLVFSSMNVCASETELERVWAGSKSMYGLTWGIQKSVERVQAWDIPRMKPSDFNNAPLVWDLKA